MVVVLLLGGAFAIHAQTEEEAPRDSIMADSINGRSSESHPSSLGNGRVATELGKAKDEAKSKQKASKYFNNDHTHTSLIGAQMNARSVARGLRDIHSPLAEYLKK